MNSILLSEAADRSTVWSFEVDGRHVRWCGTLTQFEKDAIQYCESYSGTWKRTGSRSLEFRAADGSITRFHAVPR